MFFSGPHQGQVEIATLGVLTCGAMIFGLGWTNWLRLGVWLVIGLVVLTVVKQFDSRTQKVTAIHGFLRALLELVRGVEKRIAEGYEQHDL